MSRNPASKGKADSNQRAIADAIRLHTEGDGAVTARMTVADRFWPKVRRAGPGECWEWTALTNKGRMQYGTFILDGKHALAHRVAFYLTHGKWADPCCLHSCDNPKCCNPAHLREGSYVENMKDMDARGRRRQPYGEGHGNCQISDQAIRDIRANYALCRVSQPELGRRFGVSQSHINRIVNGQSRARPGRQ